MRTMLVLLASAVAAHSVEWHVATNGDDANPGDTAMPLRTIQAAAQKAQAGDTVLVHAGTYRETVTPANSGADGKPIVFKPFAQDKVIISGTEIVTGWADDGGKRYAADLPAGFYRSVYNYSDQVFVDGRMIIEARWPDLAFERISYPRMATITAFVSKTRDKQANWTIGVFEDEACRFDEIGRHLTGARLTLQPSREMWSWTSSGTVERVEATVAGGTRFTYRTRNDGGVDGKTEIYDVGARYHVFGSKALLDVPGEWHRDPVAGRLYVRLPGDAKPGREAGVVEARKRDFAFNLTDRAHITIQGFELFACTITTDDKACSGIGHQPDGRTLYPWRGADGAHPKAHHVIIDGITARYPSHYNDQSGDFFMTFGFNTGIIIAGSDNVVRDCDIRFSAGNGISMSGLRNKAIGNRISDVSYNQQDCAGITTHGGALKSYDLEIAWNTITRTGRSGLTLRSLYNSTPGSGVTRIHHNRISRFMIQDSDGGGMYTYGIPSGFVRIDHNLVHDGHGSARGIYVDYGSEYIIDHNVVWNVQSPLYPLKCSDMHIYNNTLVDLFSGYDYQGLVFGIVSNGKRCVMQNNLGITYHPVRDDPKGEGDKFPAGVEILAKSNNVRWDGRFGSPTDPRVADLLGHDYRPTKESPMIGAGVRVQDQTITRDGATIVVKAYNEPGDGTPSIGAYQTAVPAAPAPGVNLAAGRPVTASSSKEDAQEGFGAAKLTDGEINAVQGRSIGWRSDADLDRQHREWVQIDLGSTVTVARVDLYPRNDGPTEIWGWDRGNIGRGVPGRISIQMSDDPAFATGVTTIVADAVAYERSHAWSHRFAPVRGRHLRITGEDLIPYPYDHDKKDRAYIMQLAEVQAFAASAPMPEPVFPGNESR